ncbi:MAG: hypothetical protein ABFS02_03350 [Pseudomonadota bacterium]
MKRQKYLSSLPIVLDVSLHHGRTLVGNFKTRIVGFNCIQVAADSIGLEIHDAVYITFTIANRRFGMKGLYTHHSNDTATIILTRYVTAYSDTLTKLLNQEVADADCSLKWPEMAEDIAGRRSPRVLPQQASDVVGPAPQVA